MFSSRRDGGPDVTGPQGQYDVSIGLGQTASFEVRLVGNGNGFWSDSATATEPGPTFEGPSGFTATAVGDTSIQISWAGDPDDVGADEYALGGASDAPGAMGYVPTFGGERYWGYTPGQSTISYTAGGLTPGTEYDIMLMALTPDPNTGQLEETWQHVRATTTGSVVPNAPPELHATLQTTNTTYKYPQDVFLYWQNSSSNETSFDIERSTTSDFSKHDVVYSTAADDTQYLDTDLQLTQFWYRVRAVNGTADSAWSPAVTVLVHYKIDLQFNAFIPKRLGVPASAGKDYNWIKVPDQLPGGNWHEYFGTDNRSKAGQPGTSRIHTDMTIDTTQIGSTYTAFTAKAYADPSHQALAYDGSGEPVISPTSIQAQTGSVSSNAWSTDLSDSNSSTRLNIDASGGYPFLPSPDIYIFISWTLTIGPGLSVNIKLDGTTTAFPAFEGMANGKVIFQRIPDDTGPSFLNLGPLSPDVPVHGSTTLP